MKGYSFFRYTASPKRIAEIARVAPKPGVFGLGEGTAVTAVVGGSVGEGVGTVVLTMVCVVAREVTCVGVRVVCIDIVVAFVISGFTPWLSSVIFLLIVLPVTS